MPARSLCPLVSIPLKSPPAILQTQPLAVQKPLSVPQGRVTIVPDAAGEAECNTPVEPEEVVPKAVDLGHGNDTVNTEESQCECDQQQELPPDDAPLAETMPVAFVGLRPASDAGCLSDSGQLVDSQFA